MFSGVFNGLAQAVQSYPMLEFFYKTVTIVFTNQA